MTTASCVLHPHEDYLHAATVLWGDAGARVVNTFARLNAEHFDSELPPLPMVIGITAYGRCLGITRYSSHATGGLPRITIASNLFSSGVNRVADTVLHEMVHAHLMLAGRDTTHNGRPWCEELERLSPAVLGRTVCAKPVTPRRIDGKVRRAALGGHLTRKQLASWPHSLRGDDFDGGQVLPVDSC